MNVLSESIKGVTKLIDRRRLVIFGIQLGYAEGRIKSPDALQRNQPILLKAHREIIRLKAIREDLRVAQKAKAA